MNSSPFSFHCGLPLQVARHLHLDIFCISVSNTNTFSISMMHYTKVLQIGYQCLKFSLEIPSLYSQSYIFNAFTSRASLIASFLSTCAPSCFFITFRPRSIYFNYLWCMFNLTFDMHFLT